MTETMTEAMTTATLFLTFVADVALAVALTAARYLPRGTAVGVTVGLSLWLGYVGVLSRSGMVADTTLRPPAILLVVGPVVLFILIAVARSRAAARIARAVPLWLLIGFQVYRVGVELLLHRLWGNGLAPRMLTYEGANLDILVGLSAPLLAGLAARNWLRAALAWNVLGLLALANVVVRSALTAPGPLNLIHAEVPNLVVATFPFTFLPGFLAPLAVALHVLAIRSLRARVRYAPGTLSAAALQPDLGNAAPARR